MQEFTQSKINLIKQEIIKKQKLYPQEWLGRALAYTPYQPRELKLESKKILYLNNINTKNLKEKLESIKETEQTTDAFITESLEILTLLRRYISKPLIYNFLILDSYQLLESLVYGADVVYFYPQYLAQKELNNLSEYATKLGLDRIFFIDSKENLTKAIFAKADILHINTNHTLIPKIPQNKTILSENLQNVDIEIKQFLS
ncbi:MAG: hypothetical protein SOW25_05970 [Helicobacter sp.]|nr:hypothetical protein [Helicobacter sp.]